MLREETHLNMQPSQSHFQIGRRYIWKGGGNNKINTPSQDTMQCKSGNDYKKLLLVAPSCALF